MIKSFSINKNTNPSVNEEKIYVLACILVEAAMIDEVFGEDEKTIILNILKNYFNLNDNNYLQSMIEKAINTFKESSDLITHTKKIKENWALSDRRDVIEMLWKVCLVDGKLEPYEDMLIRRIAGLIYVDDKNRNVAKKKAMENLNK